MGGRVPRIAWQGRPVDVASVSKLFTSVAVLQLVAAGRLDLDASIHEYVDLTSITIAPAVTLRHLLTHTSGIADIAEENEGENYAEVFRVVPCHTIITPRAGMTRSGYFDKHYAIGDLAEGFDPTGDGRLEQNIYAYPPQGAPAGQGFGLEFNDLGYYKEGESEGASGIFSHLLVWNADIVILSNTMDGTWPLLGEFVRRAREARGDDTRAAG